MRPAARRALVAALIVALVAIAFTAVRKQVRDGNDFPIYWDSARAMLAGRGLYDVGTGLHGYVYLPWFALLLVPLALLPLPLAAACWFVANVVFAWHAGRVLIEALRAAGIVVAPRTLALAALPLAGLAHDNLVLGQANLLLLWLIALTVRGALATRPTARSGAPLGLAAALKMPAGLLLLPLALRGHIRVLAGFVATVALALVLPMLRTGPLEGARLLDDWRAKVVAPAAAGTLQGSKVIDQSPHAALRRLLVDAPAFDETHVNIAALPPEDCAAWSRTLAMALVVAYASIWWLAPSKATPRALMLDLALACCAMVQVTGFNLKAQFIVLLLPAWAAASLVWAPQVRAPRPARGLLIAAGALFLLSQPGLVGRAASNWMLAYSALGVGTLLLAITCVWLRFATPSPSVARVAAPKPETAR